MFNPGLSYSDIPNQASANVNCAIKAQLIYLFGVAAREIQQIDVQIHFRNRTFFIVRFVCFQTTNKFEIRKVVGRFIWIRWGGRRGLGGWDCAILKSCFNPNPTCTSIQPAAYCNIGISYTLLSGRSISLQNIILLRSM